MKIGVIGDDPAGPVLAKAWANAGRGDRRIGQPRKAVGADQSRQHA